MNTYHGLQQISCYAHKSVIQSSAVYLVKYRAHCNSQFCLNIFVCHCAEDPHSSALYLIRALICMCASNQWNAKGIQTFIHSIYIRTVGSFHLLPVLSNCLKLLETGFIGPQGKATSTTHSISTQTSHEGFKCTKAKEQLRSYCTNIYTVHSSH